MTLTQSSGRSALPLAVVPAAGSSQRMGRPKLLLPWRHGLTVLESTLAALRDGGVTLTVVVGAPQGPLANWQAPAGTLLSINPAPEAGMISTVMVGLATLGALGMLPEPLLVCPGDLPSLRPETVVALLAAYRAHGGVVVPQHGNKRGHPLLLSPTWQARVPELASRRVGLRRILELAAGAVHVVEVDDPGAISDVDTPGQYERLRPG